MNTLGLTKLRAIGNNTFMVDYVLPNETPYNNWYKATGVTKLCEIVLFQLLNRIIPVIGANIGAFVNNPDAVNIYFSVLISKVESEIKSSQRRSDIPMPLEETLESITVVSIDIDPDNQRVLVVIEIINGAQETARLVA